MGKRKDDFNLMDLLNQRSKETVVSNDETESSFMPEPVEDEINMIDIYDLIPSKENFYDTAEGIKELRQSIELVGILQPFLIKANYEIIAGHRRRLAILELVEEGKEEFRMVPCIKKHNENVILDKLSLIMANSYRDKTDWEKMTEAIQTEELVLELREEYGIRGQTRKLISQIIKTTPAQVGRFKTIYNNLSQELMEEFKKNNIGISVANEAAGLPEEYQGKAFDIFKDNGKLSINDVLKIKKEEEEQRQIPGQMDIEDVTEGQDEDDEKTEDAEDFDPQPKTVDSLCYSCKNYMDCHEKKSNVTDCNNYIDKAEAEKTPEQKYAEEQAKIDRETAKKLSEQAEQKKMEELPGEKEKKTHEVVIPAASWNDIAEGVQSFLLLENAGYKTNERIQMKEYKSGNPTGRIMEAKIKCILKEYRGIEEGYCILGIERKEKENG